jgi:hypothetical protein
VNLLKEKKGIEAALDSYRQKLDVIPDDLFDVTPPAGGWSYAEVYSHIMQATLLSHIAIDRCTFGAPKPIKDKANWLGKMVLLFGRFPPGIRIKAPQKVSDKMPPQKISKEDARNLIIKCRKRLEDTLPQVKNDTVKNRSKHPRMGMLNAPQWFRFIRIHLQHHLLQLKRIDADFNKR